MKKQIRKSSNGMSMFKRLSLGNMIPAWVGILLGIVFIALFVAESPILGNAIMIMALDYVIAACAVASAVMGIAQAVEGRYYGDVFGKMTKRNTTIMFTVFMSVCMFGLVLILMSVIIMIPYASKNDVPKTIQTLCHILQYGGIDLFILSWIGHAITSSIIVAKAK